MKFSNVSAIVHSHSKFKKKLTFQNFHQLLASSRLSGKQKFSKVSALVSFLYTITKCRLLRISISTRGLLAAPRMWLRNSAKSASYYVSCVKSLEGWLLRISTFCPGSPPLLQRFKNSQKSAAELLYCYFTTTLLLFIHRWLTNSPAVIQKFSKTSCRAQVYS